MGKSSLMTQMVKQLREHHVAPAVLDLSNQGFNLDARQWYNGLLEQLGRRLKLDDEIEDFCRDHRHLSPLQLWQQALRDVVLEAMPDQQVVIFIDEIDVVRSLPFSTDEFFAAIRACYNARTEDPTFARLSFCLLGVATPADLISNPKLTPFNIGTRIELTDFSREEAKALEVGLGQDAGVNRVLMDRILYWTSGHPYLTQRLCQAVAADDAHLTAGSVDGCAARLFLSVKAQRQDSNLSFVQQRMLPMEEEQRVGLLTLYAKVLSGKPVLDSDTIAYVSELKLAGIVQAVLGQLKVRNRIYAQVFDRSWINENMPDAETRRQRAAVSKARWQVGSIAALVLAIIGSLAFIAVSQANRAGKIADRERIARIAADNNAERAERTAYIADMNLMQHEWDLNNVGRVLELLEDTRKSDFRDFEWGYWNRLCHLDLITLKGHTDRVKAVAFSFDGKRIVTGSDDCTAKVWDAVTGQEILTLKLGRDEVDSVAFSPDGKRILTNNTIWDAKTGQKILTLKDSGFYSYAFSPDGKHIHGGSDPIGETIWDAKTGQKILSLKGASSPCAFSPDGTLAAARSSNGVGIWDARSGQKMLTLKGHTGDVNSVAFSPDSKHIVAGSGEILLRSGLRDFANSTVRVWDAMTGRETLALKGYTNAVTSVGFSPDGRRIVAGSSDKTARVWDATTGSEILTLKGHTDDVASVMFSPDGKRLLTGSFDKTAKVWDATTGHETFMLSDHIGPVSSLAFSFDGKRLVTGSHQFTVEATYDRYSTSFNISEPNQFGNNMAMIWDIMRGYKTLTLKGSTEITSVACSSDGRRIVTGSFDKTAKVWDATTGHEISTLKLKDKLKTSSQGEWVIAVAFSPDGKRILTGNWDNTATLWNSATGQDVLILEGHTHGVTSVAFSSDGKWIITGSFDKTARVWDAATGHKMVILKGHMSAVASVAFSPDSTHIVTGSFDNTAKVWDAATGREILTLKGHTGPVNSVAFSPNGKRIITGSVDRTAIVWDATTGHELLTLKGHTQSIRAVAFSPDGKRAATGSIDKTARIWETLFN
jgi:WD40 repeat protein